ncbi:hypothetical protein A4H97_30100 [Niastella yeongjuensis]|uniref:Uncharacterized protein n=1 Tax=Niastella yeongjuensis TaxID=354355 RepID=A0A1V9EPP5_9BACT|nr:hypothetical protein [Niastella yeongjuensis]OQP48086.1 hypothetical protein A4H97_30100 [Niastella yeongjuensis]SEO26192.1 hypothetical protein SAMN05660816_02421 [Niastella yeongjuensis]
MDLSVIPECYVDTNLIETLVPPNRGYNHQKGCGTVTKVMQEHFADNFALGIVDKDKQELDYLKKFLLVLAKGNIELYKHNSRNHYILRVIPAIEKFILYNVDKAGINIEDFGLPADFDKFRKATKMVNSKKDEKFKTLFRVLRDHQLEDFNLLTNCIKYLLAHPFNADLEALKAL